MDNILIFGDICPEGNHRELFDKGNIKEFFGEVGRNVEKAEFVIGNLEAPIINQKNPIKKCGPVLSMAENDLVELKNIGFHAVSLANNHIFDHGKTGLFNTIENLKKNKILYLGAGKEKEEVHEPLIIEVANKRVAILSFAEQEFNVSVDGNMGANIFDSYTSLLEINCVKSQVDYVVVLYHGGIEYYEYPSPELQKKCRAMCDMGADLVICQHSHCIGTWEKYKDKKILYGQGNAIFGYRENNESWNTGLLVNLKIQENIVELIPIKATSKGISLLKDEEKKKVICEIEKRGEKVNDIVFLENNWKKFTENKSALYMAMVLGKSRVFNKINRILHNSLLKVLLTDEKIRTCKNLVRCPAHREVLVTILNNWIKDDVR